MNPARPPIFSRPALAFLIAGVVVLCFAIMGWRIAPHASTASAGASAVQVIVGNPEHIRPERQEWSAYLAMLLSTPFAVGLGIWLTSGMSGEKRLAPADLALFLAGLGLAAVAIARDELTTLFRTDVPLVTGLTATTAGLLAAILQPMPEDTAKKVNRYALPALCIFGVLVTFGWRVLDAETISALAFVPHFSAFFYSIAQISLGATCTVDVLPQYGCYGEFYAPVLKLAGVSVLSSTLLSALVQSCALVSIIVFASRLIRSPIILVAAGLWVIILLNWVLLQIADPYFQYGPVRLLFPALSLPMALWFSSSPTCGRAVVLGIFGALAVAFNPDSGSVVLLALTLLALAAPVAIRSPAPFAGAVLSMASCLAAALAAGIAFWLLLAWKGDSTPQLGKLLSYSMIFAAKGFMMLPLQGLPAIWGCLAAVLLLGIVFGAAELTVRWNRDALAILYVSILSAGLLSYHVGRSHPNTLLLCMWPTVIVTAVLLDRAAALSGSTVNRSFAITARTAGGLALGLAAAVMAGGLPFLVDTSMARWSSNLSGSAGHARDNLRFISRESGSDGFEPISLDQPIILAESGRRSGFSGPGLAEILLQTDSDNFIDYLMKERPKHLFVDYRLLENQLYWFNTVPWIRNALPRLRSLYWLKGWSPDGQLMHLALKPSSGEDLFDSKMRCDRPECPPSEYMLFSHRNGATVFQWGRPVRLPTDITISVPPKGFDIIMDVEPRRKQVPYATIVSNHCCEFMGFTIHHQPGTTADYVLASGDGKSWHASSPFVIEPGRKSQLSLSYADGHFSVSVNGKVATELNVADAQVGGARNIPLTFGDWINRGRPFDGEIYFAALVPRGTQAEE